MNITENNYDAGRLMNTFVFLDQISDKYYQIYARIKSQPHIGTFQVFTSLTYKERYINTLFTAIQEAYASCLQEYKSDLPSTYRGNIIGSSDGGLAMELGNISIYKMKIEDLVFQMRIVVDTLVQLIYIARFNSEFHHTKIVRCDSIGTVLSELKKSSPSKEGEELGKLINGDGVDYDADNTKFLEVLNELFNSMKHCTSHNEAYTAFGYEYPTILSIYVPRNDYGKDIVYHNHNLYHIMMGFQDNVARLQNNLAKFLNLHP